MVEVYEKLREEFQLERFIELYFDSMKREAIKKYHKIKYRQIHFIFDNREEVLKTKPLEAIKSLAICLYGAVPIMNTTTYHKYFYEAKPYLESNDYIGFLKETLKLKDFIQKPSCRVFDASKIEKSKLEYLENNSLFKFSSSMGDFVIYYHLNCPIPEYAQEFKLNYLEDTQYLKSYWNHLKREQQKDLYRELGMDVKIDQRWIKVLLRKLLVIF